MKIRTFQLRCRNIDIDNKIRNDPTNLCCILQSLPYNPVTQFKNTGVLLNKRNKTVWRYKSILVILPAYQSLCTYDPIISGIYDRLVVEGKSGKISHNLLVDRADHIPIAKFMLMFFHIVKNNISMIDGHGLSDRITQIGCNTICLSMCIAKNSSAPQHTTGYMLVTDVKSPICHGSNCLIEQFGLCPIHIMHADPIHGRIHVIDRSSFTNNLLQFCPEKP